jgi:ABC-type Fe3+/spermidine/putrescine transport system ATPase subunit
MKIKKITLKDFQQFENVVFDFTYPEGHENAGQPLKKICFIGQSGTGKTTLLRIIKYFTSRDKSIGPNFNFIDPPKDRIFVEIFQGKLFSKQTVNDSTFYISNYTLDGKTISYTEWDKLDNEYRENLKPILINYPAEVIRGNNPLKIDISDEIKQKKLKDKLTFISTLKPQQIVDFTIDEIENIRNYVFKEIKEHRAKELLYKNKISEIVLSEKSTPSDIKKINKDYEKWLKVNPNPLTKLAEECLNPLLVQFGLKVKTKIDLDSILELGDIQLQTISGEDVDRPFWSTGTRHLVDTIVPLFELKPNNAIILFDEIEKSLYPDIQKSIVDFLCNLNKNCQYFFATHSPIIASSFDPWEVFHLEFDKHCSNVVLTQNYTGKKHVDNYDYYPKYLRWDSIIMKVFNLNDEGNDREEILIEVATLYKELKELNEKGKRKTSQYKKLYSKFLILSKKVGWDAKDIEK